MCGEGLRTRGKGEEIFIDPLRERIEYRTNPASEMLAKLHSGHSLKDIITSYSLINRR